MNKRPRQVRIMVNISWHYSFNSNFFSNIKMYRYHTPPPPPPPARKWAPRQKHATKEFDKNICNLQQYYVIWLQATAFWYRKSDHPAVYHLKGTVSRDFRHSLWKTLRGTKQKRFFFLFRRFPRKTCVYVVVDYADTVSNSNILKSWKWGVTVQANFLNFVIEYLCENEKVR